MARVRPDIDPTVMSRSIVQPHFLGAFLPNTAVHNDSIMTTRGSFIMTQTDYRKFVITKQFIMTKQQYK
jgi:hypothetical protein